MVAQLVECPPGLPMCSQKECPTKFETRWLQEIPFSKELTDNYCALGLLFESITCNNNGLGGQWPYSFLVKFWRCQEARRRHFVVPANFTPFLWLTNLYPLCLLFALWFSQQTKILMNQAEDDHYKFYKLWAHPLATICDIKNSFFFFFYTLKNKTKRQHRFHIYNAMISIIHCVPIELIPFCFGNKSVSFENN